MLLTIPLRWLPWVAVAGALVALSTLGALLLSTTVGLFGFVETTAALLWWESLWVELAATIVLDALTVSTRRHVHRATTAVDGR